MDNETFRKIKIGDRISSNDGFKRRFGKVYGKVSDRWGNYLKVKLDDYTFTFAHNFVSAPHTNEIGFRLER